MSNLTINELPVVSVVVVTLNVEKTLEQTLLSVINQSYRKIELIVIDGGSTDGTVDIIRRLEGNIAYWVSDPDKGVYDAMNKAVAIASGKWIYFLGSGDVLINVVDKIVPMFVNDKVIYYGNVYRNDLLKVYDGKYSAFKLSRLTICHQAIFYPLEAVHKYGFNTKYKVQADHHLNMVLHADKKFKFKYIPVLIALYDGTGISAVTKDMPFFKDRLSLVKANFSPVIFLYASARSMVAKLLKRGHLDEIK